MKKINIIKITDEKGNEFIPVFTDWDNLQLNHEFSQAVFFPLKDCLTVIRNDQSLYGTVINPYSDNLVISKETLNLISEDSNIMKNENV